MSAEVRSHPLRSFQQRNIASWATSTLTDPCPGLPSSWFPDLMSSRSLTNFSRMGFAGAGRSSQRAVRHHSTFVVYLSKVLHERKSQLCSFTVRESIGGYNTLDVFFFNDTATTE